MPVVLRAFLCLMMVASTARASGSYSTNECLLAADQAALETGVPSRLLRAITRVETQYGGEPWPWTVNVGGTGNWFPTRDAAEEAARKALDRNASVDIGCFQINTHWHSDGFSSLQAMFDPEMNAHYAANHLLALHKDKGNWTDAVAAYHSGDPERGRSYVERVGLLLSGDDAQADSGTAKTALRQNDFPLFVAGAEGAPGSLVPRQTRRVPIIGGP